MKIFFKIIFLLIILSVNAEAQTVTWQNVYNYNGQRAAARDVIQTMDGGYIVCGTILFPVRIYLIKLNSLGIQEWNNIIADSAGAFLQALSIQQTADSGFVMTGRLGINLAIIKTNKAGIFEWKKKYTNLGEESTGRTIKITSDHGFIVCGEIFLPPLSPSYVVKTDNNGNIQWERIYVDSGSTTSISSDIIELYDHYYLTGISNTTYGYLRKLDHDGNQIWQLNFPSIIFFPKVLKLLSNQLIVAGIGSPYGIFFGKIDTSGSILINKVIPTNSFEFYFYSMCLNSSQEIVVGGKERYPKQIGSTYFAAAVIDSNGNLLREKRLNSPKNVENAPYAIQSTLDNGYIFAGDTEFYPKSGNFNTDNILVAKTDSNFNTPQVVNVENDISIIDKNFILFQNYPNPFNPETTIKYELSKSGFVNMKIFDLNGKEICSIINKFQQPGNYEIQFNSLQYNLSSGIFFCKMNVSNKSNIIKLVIIK